MRLQIIEGKFSVCKVENLRAVNFNVPWLFVGKTDAEISVVCLTADVPHATLAREDGWRALRVAESMDFGLTGVLAGISTVLAQAGISIFAVSTFDTDYILIKAENLGLAQSALEAGGYTIENPVR
ncbi:MAG: ACT domain-containing protein [Deltaproteobacteria bacterium]|jgi:uncharacterized protein|nr:ACT domain-containing protein [Deltaproteobacteria bacterium]